MKLGKKQEETREIANMLESLVTSGTGWVKTMAKYGATIKVGKVTCKLSWVEANCTIAYEIRPAAVATRYC